MNKLLIVLSLLLFAGSVSALDCDTPAGTRAVRGGSLVNDLSIDEEIALEDELQESCNEGVEYTRYYEVETDKYRVDVTCYEDSAPSVERTLDLVCD